MIYHVLSFDRYISLRYGFRALIIPLNLMAKTPLRRNKYEKNHLDICS
jgi:hypothetical protein